MPERKKKKPKLKPLKPRTTKMTMSIDALNGNLDSLGQVKVALESMDATRPLPADARVLLSIFMGPSVSLESASKSDVALESVGSKIADFAKKVADWIKTQIQEFIAFLKSGKLEIDAVEKELAQIKTAVAGFKDYKEGEISVSPMIVNALAINGELDEKFPDDMVRINDMLNLIFDMQPEGLKLAKKIITDLKADNFALQGSADTFAALGMLLKRYAGKLVSADTSKSLFNSKNRHSKLNTLTRQPMKVQDLMSLPLPGGYALVGSFIDSGNMIRGANNSKSIIKALLESAKPELVKTEGSGAAFTGKGLSHNAANKIINSSEHILATIRKDFASDDVADVLKSIADAVSTMKDFEDKNGVEFFSLSDRVGILSDLVKFIDMDKSKLVRYALKVIRYAVRYIHVSIKGEAKEVDVNSRLSAAAN